MIQRIQTLFLILAAVVNLLVLFLPLGAAAGRDSMESLTVEMTGMSITRTGLDEEKAEFVEETIGFADDSLLMIHVLLVALLSVYILVLVFLFNDRPRQIRMSYVGVILLMGQLTLAAVLFMQLPALAGNPSDLGHDIGYGFFIPAISLMLLLLAIRSIRKDERMVRDSNRLR